MIQSVIYLCGMKFQTGDRVIVQHSNEEGEVVEIINDKMVMVNVRGVKFPAYIDQLDFPYFKQFSQKKLFASSKDKKYVDQLPKEKAQRVARVADGIWLTFLPVFESDEFGDDVVESFKLHLVNNTQSAYRFTYRLNYFGKPDFELSNDIFVFHDFYLNDISFASLNDSPNFAFDFELLTPDKTRADHYETSLKLKPKQVFSRIEEIKKKGEASFSYKLFDEYPLRPESPELDIQNLTGSNFRIYDASRARQHLEPAKQELDLHIQKLTDDTTGLDSFEMISLQLQTFEKYLDLAIAHHQPSMVVIHGIGTGKLRDEIHEILRLKKEVRSFVNQYDARYGYGATEIFFHRNFLSILIFLFLT